MRNKFLLAAAIGSLALLTAAADSAQAQISFGYGRGRGWGGGDSWYVDTPYVSYGRGYYSPWYGSGYYGRGYGWYGPGYGNWGGRYSYPYRSFGVSVGSPGFYSSPSYGYSYPASYSYPMTSYSTGSMAYGSDFQGRAEAMPQEKRALIHLMLPTPDAEVWFEGEATQTRGFQRAYVSPELQPGTQYVYTVKACWMEDGQKVERTKEIDVQAGRASALAFGERAPMEETTRSAGYREGGRIDVDASSRERRLDRPDVERRDRIDVERRDRIDVEKRTDIDRPRTDVDVNVDANRNRNLDREKNPDVDRPRDPAPNKPPDRIPPGGTEPSGKTNNGQTPPPE